METGLDNNASELQQSLVQRVVLEGLTKVFRRPGGQTVRALSGLSLAIEDKECVALVGPTGSGKTTALRLIAGLDEPTSGTLSIGGTVVNGTPPKNRDVAMVFQSPALYPHMTVSQNLGFGLRLRKYSGHETVRRVQEMAELLGLGSVLDSKPMALSAGQRQRVALGRAMVRRASVLLLDEPLANVDPTLRAQMREQIAQLRRQFGTTMIYVTHDHLEAMLVGDRVVVLREGELQQVAEPQVVYRRPANLFVATFIGAPPMNLFAGSLVREAGEFFFEPASSASLGPEKARQFSRIELGANPAAGAESGRSIVMGLRPEHIRCAAGAYPPTHRLMIRGRILSAQDLGPDTYLRVHADDYVFVVRACTASQPVIGQECSFVLDIGQACFFDPTTGRRC